eukprot:m.136742 g.136742  ORF g.136742 m.136742 type:complete len:220 (+) comp13956_c0_seq4:681-1340(+)
MHNFRPIRCFGDQVGHFSSTLGMSDTSACDHKIYFAGKNCLKNWQTNSESLNQERCGQSLTRSAPVESRWSTAPSKRYVSVQSPMCGCGPTFTGLDSVKFAGPISPKKIIFFFDPQNAAFGLEGHVGQKILRTRGFLWGLPPVDILEVNQVAHKQVGDTAYLKKWRILGNRRGRRILACVFGQCGQNNSVAMESLVNRAEIGILQQSLFILGLKLISSQ